MLRLGTWKRHKIRICEYCQYVVFAHWMLCCPHRSGLEVYNEICQNRWGPLIQLLLGLTIFQDLMPSKKKGQNYAFRGHLQRFAYSWRPDIAKSIRGWRNANKDGGVLLSVVTYSFILPKTGFGKSLLAGTTVILSGMRRTDGWNKNV